MINKEFTLEGKIAAMRQNQKEWQEKYHSNSEKIPSSSFSTDKNKGIIPYVVNKISDSHWLSDLI